MVNTTLIKAVWFRRFGIYSSWCWSGWYYKIKDRSHKHYTPLCLYFSKEPTIPVYGIGFTLLFFTCFVGVRIGKPKAADGEGGGGDGRR